MSTNGRVNDRRRARQVWMFREDSEWLISCGCAKVVREGWGRIQCAAELVAIVLL